MAATYLSIWKGTGLNTTKVPIKDGQLLFETDTKKIWLDAGAQRLQVGGQDTIAWDNVTGKPDSFVPVEHSHSFILQNDAVAQVSTNVRPMLSIGGSTNSFALEKYSNENNLQWHNYLDGVYDGTYTILDSHNYNEFTVTKTGSGASGTWPISISGNAYSVRDVGDGRTLTFNYSADGLSSVVWLAGWNGNELRAVSPYVITTAAATKLATARTFAIGHSSFSFDGTADVGLDTSKIFATKTADLSISWDDLPTGFTEMIGNNDYGWSGTNNPTDMPGFYKWGGTLTLNANGGAFAQLYFAHISSSSSGILYRSGWYTDKQPWARILDSNNYTSYCAPASHAHSYLPLAGGTLTGSLAMAYTASTLSMQNGADGQYYTILQNHNNGNLTFDAPGGSIYIGYYNPVQILFNAGSWGKVTSSGIYGAVWNDYAEFRSGSTTEPGRVVHESLDGILRPSTSRLEPGCEIISDTFGFAIGETDECKTPIAVAGRVLAYTDADRHSFNLGDAVCSGSNGTVSRMTREEIREYPERILGTVSEIPEYETWGTGNIKINGRIWIRIR